MGPHSERGTVKRHDGVRLVSAVCYGARSILLLLNFVQVTGGFAGLLTLSRPVYDTKSNIFFPFPCITHV